MKKELTIRYDVFANADELSDADRQLFDKAAEARTKAYAPYSDFLVGCALLLDNGETVTGSNQENAAYPSGLCAERSTIFWTHGNFPDQRILKMFVVGGPRDGKQDTAVPPCGACRQSILEYERLQSEDIEFFFGSPEGEIVRCGSIRDLVPFSFGAEFL
ncbi:MAG: cytidine deaminase [Chryseobacterium sp.]|nr:MAG: cytidine deaminase [Chryseobacterium sp.]